MKLGIPVSFTCLSDVSDIVLLGSLEGIISWILLYIESMTSSDNKDKLIKIPLEFLE